MMLLRTNVVVLLLQVLCGVEANRYTYRSSPPPPAADFVYVLDPTDSQKITLTSTDGKVLVTAICQAPLVATMRGCKFPRTGAADPSLKLPEKTIKLGSNGKATLSKNTVATLVKSLECQKDRTQFVNVGGNFYKATLVSSYSDCVTLSLQAPIETLTNSNTSEILGASPLTLHRNRKGSYNIVARFTQSTPSDTGAAVIQHHRRRLLRTPNANDFVTCGGAAAGVGVTVALVAFFACLVTIPFYGLCVALALGISAGATFIACIVGIVLTPEGGGCFPADALLRLPGGYPIPMAQLQIGHSVASGPTHLGTIAAMGAGLHSSLADPGRFSEIYAFGHRDAEAFSPFIHILLGSNKSIEVSPRHFLPYSASPSSGAPRFKHARDIVPGDYLWESKGSGYSRTRVVGSKVVIKKGLYNPLSLSGTIEVNGVIASCHSEWFLDDVVPTTVIPHLPAIYQGVLYPARALYRIVGGDGAKELDAKLSFHTTDGSATSFVSLLASATKASLQLALAS